MVHTDEENKRWWKSLTKYDQEEILQTMVEKGSGSFREMAESFVDQFERGRDFTPKQLVVIRKWDK